MAEEKRLEIPYAVSNFARLREENYYYVDKTMYIEQLEKYSAPVFLRPRRFGKSLLVSVLEHYYDRSKRERFDSLFAGTYIGGHPTDRHSKFIIIRYNFSTMQVVDDMTQLKKNFDDAYIAPVEIAVAHNSDILNGFVPSDPRDASKMLADLLNYISKNNLPQAYILIDEYDNFTNQMLTANNDHLYEDVTTGDSFLRTFFKVIKAGLETGAVNTCFCTGVLPVTIDDMTSGYNVAQVITLEPEFRYMLGFTHEEARTYLRYVLERYIGSQERFDEIWQLLLSNYDSYRFSSDAEPLFNSTIISYFLQKFANQKEVPNELIDYNLRTDVNWIRRLTLTLDNAKEMLDKLLIDGELSFLSKSLASKFNKRKFFNKDYYPASLFYLGMVSIKDAYNMALPNLTMKNIYMDYYNELHDVGQNDAIFAPYFETFAKDRRLETLVQMYFEKYLGQFPAQAFDKVNENFIRCSFFGMVSQGMYNQYTFSMENNLPSGRTDFEMIGVPGTSYHNDVRLIEFKYFHAKDERRIKGKREPYAEDKKQVLAYKADIQAQWPQYKITAYVVYICANRCYKCFNLGL
ncbi:MAG: AAA family ATPase [Prevotellaceae bacterium]|nr:AAA family ATPase [Prevotellaceae bacterium]